MAQFHHGYTHKSGGCPIPNSASHSYANKGNHQQARKGPHTELKTEPCSAHSCTVSSECSLIDKSLGRGI